MLAQLSLPPDHNERVQAGDYTDYKLRGAHLRNADLENATMCRIDLTEAMLDQARLCQADLRDAVIENASLVKADLKGTILSGARLRDADLRDADLQQSQILSTRQLAGTNVSGAKLPDNVKAFEALQSIRESSENSRKIFVSLSLLAAYSCLTIAATKDAALLTNTGTLQLPIIQTQIPIGWFYWVTPLMLLGTFLYFQFYLQNLWEELSQLPAYFPDGRPLHQRVYPWLVNSIARVHFPRLRSERGTLATMQYLVTVLLTWWVVPITQLVFWLRYLPRHEWMGTTIHVVLAVASFTVALLFFRLAGATLRGKAGDSGLRTLLSGEGPMWYTLTSAVLFALLLSSLSFGAIKAEPGHVITDPRTWVPLLFRCLHLRYAAQLEEEDVSGRPTNWSEKEPSFDSVKGAHLAGRDLRNAEARHAFLVGADLTGATLAYADLRGADLRHSVLTAANLKGANLTGAKLEGARLDGCNLLGVIGYSDRLSNQSVSPK
jgi:uncharacterized protein YjbI with pentapeptide repeats